MTEYLIRRFVKDYKNIHDATVRTSYGVLSSIVGILCNILLFGAKLAAGIILGSIAVTADAFNNLSDAASSIIGYIGIKIAEMPADRKHPFGHGRIEYISAFIVSCLVIQVGLTFMKSSFVKLGHPEELKIEWVAFSILILSVAVKGWMAAFNRKLGKRVDSKVMLATAADSMGDMITTGATILSILIYYFFHINVDAIAGMIVSVLVILAGVDIAKDTLAPLIGEPTDPELIEGIKKKVKEHPDVLGFHDLIVHNYGPNKSMASMHVEISRDMDVEDSHQVIDTLEREILKELGVFMVIHMDPVNLKDMRVRKVKAQLREMLAQTDGNVSFHDFRVIWGEKQITLIFDILVPYSYNEREQQRLKETIEEKMKKVDSRYMCIIDIDNSYAG